MGHGSGNLTRELYHACLARGEIDFATLRTVAVRMASQTRSMAVLRLPDVLKEDGPQIAMAFPDLVLMFDTTIMED